MDNVRAGGLFVTVSAVCLQREFRTNEDPPVCAPCKPFWSGNARRRARTLEPPPPTAQVFRQTSPAAADFIPAASGLSIFFMFACFKVPGGNAEHGFMVLCMLQTRLKFVAQF